MIYFLFHSSFLYGSKEIPPNKKDYSVNTAFSYVNDIERWIGRAALVDLIIDVGEIRLLCYYQVCDTLTDDKRTNWIPEQDHFYSLDIEVSMFKASVYDHPVCRLKTKPRRSSFRKYG